MSTPPEEKRRCGNCRQGVSQAAWTTHEATCYRRNKYCERCGDVVQKNAFDKHIEEDHREETCPKCYEKMEAYQLPAHEEDSCPKRQVSCPYCELKKEYDEMVEHRDHCGARTDECEQCGDRVKLSDMELHRVLKHGATANGDTHEEPAPLPPATGGGNSSGTAAFKSNPVPAPKQASNQPSKPPRSTVGTGTAPTSASSVTNSRQGKENGHPSSRLPPGRPNRQPSGSSVTPDISGAGSGATTPATSFGSPPISSQTGGDSSRDKSTTASRHGVTTARSSGQGQVTSANATATTATTSSPGGSRTTQKRVVIMASSAARTPYRPPADTHPYGNMDSDAFGDVAGDITAPSTAAPSTAFYEGCTPDPNAIPVQCQYCNQQVTIGELDVHEEACLRVRGRHHGDTTGGAAHHHHHGNQPTCSGCGGVVVGGSTVRRRHHPTCPHYSSSAYSSTGTTAYPGGRGYPSSYGGYSMSYTDPMAGLGDLDDYMAGDVGTPDDADAPKAECEKCGTLIPLALLDSHEAACIQTRPGVNTTSSSHDSHPATSSTGYPTSYDTLASPSGTAAPVTSRTDGSHDSQHGTANPPASAYVTSSDQTTASSNRVQPLDRAKNEQRERQRRQDQVRAAQLHRQQQQAEYVEPTTPAKNLYGHFLSGPARRNRFGLDGSDSDDNDGGTTHSAVATTTATTTASSGTSAAKTVASGVTSASGLANPSQPSTHVTAGSDRGRGPMVSAGVVVGGYGIVVTGYNSTGGDDPADMHVNGSAGGYSQDISSQPYAGLPPSSSRAAAIQQRYSTASALRSSSSSYHSSILNHSDGLDVAHLLRQNSKPLDERPPKELRRQFFCEFCQIYCGSAVGRADHEEMCAFRKVQGDRTQDEAKEGEEGAPCEYCKKSIKLSEIYRHEHHCFAKLACEKTKEYEALYEERQQSVQVVMKNAEIMANRIEALRSNLSSANSALRHPGASYGIPTEDVPCQFCLQPYSLLTIHTHESACPMNTSNVGGNSHMEEAMDIDPIDQTGKFQGLPSYGLPAVGSSRTASTSSKTPQVSEAPFVSSVPTLPQISSSNPADASIFHPSSNAVKSDSFDLPQTTMSHDSRQSFSDRYRSSLQQQELTASFSSSQRQQEPRRSTSISSPNQSYVSRSPLSFNPNQQQQEQERHRRLSDSDRVTGRSLTSRTGVATQFPNSRNPVVSGRSSSITSTSLINNDRRASEIATGSSRSHARSAGHIGTIPVGGSLAITNASAPGVRNIMGPVLTMKYDEQPTDAGTGAGRDKYREVSRGGGASHSHGSTTLPSESGTSRPLAGPNSHTTSRRELEERQRTRLEQKPGLVLSGTNPTVNSHGQLHVGSNKNAKVRTHGDLAL